MLQSVSYEIIADRKAALAPTELTCLCTDNNTDV